MPSEVHVPWSRPIADPPATRVPSRTYGVTRSAAQFSKSWGWPGLVTPVSDTWGVPWSHPDAITITWIILTLRLTTSFGAYEVEIYRDGTASPVIEWEIGNNVFVRSLATSVNVAAFARVTPKVLAGPLLDASDLGITLVYELQ